MEDLSRRQPGLFILRGLLIYRGPPKTRRTSPDHRSSRTSKRSAFPRGPRLTPRRLAAPEGPLSAPRDMSGECLLLFMVLKGQLRREFTFQLLRDLGGFYRPAFSTRREREEHAGSCSSHHDSSSGRNVGGGSSPPTNNETGGWGPKNPPSELNPTLRFHSMAPSPLQNHPVL